MTVFVDAAHPTTGTTHVVTEGAMNRDLCGIELHPSALCGVRPRFGDGWVYIAIGGEGGGRRCNSCEQIRANWKDAT